MLWGADKANQLLVDVVQGRQVPHKPELLQSAAVLVRRGLWGDIFQHGAC